MWFRNVQKCFEMFQNGPKMTWAKTDHLTHDNKNGIKVEHSPQLRGRVMKTAMRVVDLLNAGSTQKRSMMEKNLVKANRLRNININLYTLR